MIIKQEVMDHAKRFGLDPNIVEKDYVLNWILAGIVSSETLRDKWIFKGGTCLKKCYFEQYRFSEDLDFTIIERSHIDKDLLLAKFNEIADTPIISMSAIPGIMINDFDRSKNDLIASFFCPYREKTNKYYFVQSNFCWFSLYSV